MFNLLGCVQKWCSFRTEDVIVFDTWTLSEQYADTRRREKQKCKCIRVFVRNAKDDFKPKLSEYNENENETKCAAIKSNAQWARVENNNKSRTLCILLLCVCIKEEEESKDDKKEEEGILQTQTQCIFDFISFSRFNFYLASTHCFQVLRYDSHIFDSFDSKYKSTVCVCASFIFIFVCAFFFYTS